MVKCICIDASNKPKEIPENKWLKQNEPYTIIYTCRVLPQNDIGCYIAEIDLDDSCSPYTYFLLKRFAIPAEELEKLLQLIKDCTDTDVNVAELLKQTQLVEEKI